MTLQMGILQTWLLYHNALSSGVIIEDVLKYARNSRQRADDEGDISVSALRAQLAHQEQMIQLLMQANPSANVGSSSGQRKGHTSGHKVALSGSSSETVPISKDGNIVGSVSSTEKKNYGSLSPSAPINQVWSPKLIMCTC